MHSARPEEVSVTHLRRAIPSMHCVWPKCGDKFQPKVLTERFACFICFQDLPAILPELPFISSTAFLFSLTGAGFGSVYAFGYCVVSSSSDVYSLCAMVGVCGGEDDMEGDWSGAGLVGKAVIAV